MPTQLSSHGASLGKSLAASERHAGAATIQPLYGVPRVMVHLARQLRLVGITPVAVGREGWRATVHDEYRRLTSSASRTAHPPDRSALTVALSRLRTRYERYRATESLEQRAVRNARALPEPCPECGGGGWVGVRARPGALMVAALCSSCIPLAVRAMRSGIPERFREAGLDSFRPLTGKRDALRLAQAWDGSRSVLLHGPWGAGKSRLGCGMLLRKLERGHRALFLAVPDFLDGMRRRFGEGEQAQVYADRIAAEPLLLLDDLGAERSTDWTEERLRALIDKRWREQLTTIVTTNMGTQREIADRLGGAIASRMGEWQWIEVAGRDMRGGQS